MKIKDLIEQSKVASVKMWGVRKPHTRPVSISESMLDEIQDICRIEKIDGSRYLIENTMQIFIDNYNKMKEAENGH